MSKHFTRILALCEPKHVRGEDHEDELPSKTVPVTQTAPMPPPSPPPFSEQLPQDHTSQQPSIGPAPFPNTSAPPNSPRSWHHIADDGTPRLPSTRPVDPSPSPGAVANATANSLVPDSSYDPSAVIAGEFGEAGSEPPPGYTRFDPHPPGCNCPIHIKTTSQPTVIELFQSQSCNSCPPTNANLQSLLRHSYDPNVLFLSHHVTYWDHLDWKDVFGYPEANVRQWEFARRMGRTRVYTPQVVVNGLAEGVGTTDRGLKDVVKRGQEAAKNRNAWVDVEARGDRVVVRGKKVHSGRRANVLLLSYDTRKVEVAIKTGENAGRRLTFVNVVKAVVDLGEWDGDRAEFEVERTEAGDRLGRVVIVQEGKGGPLVGVCKV